MHWTPQQISYGVDGNTHVTCPNPGTGVAAWPFDAPQFLIPNLAIGGDLGGEVDDTALPARLEVEYVRVYPPTPAKTAQQALSR